MKKNQDPSKIFINITKEQTELNDFLISWEIFGKRPNKITIHNTYLTSLFSELVNEISSEKTISSEVVATTDGKMVLNQEVFTKIEENIYLSYVIFDKNQPNSIVTDVTFFYKEEDDYDVVKEIIEEMNNCLPSFSDNDNNYNLNNIIISNSVMEVEPFVYEENENFEYYYTEPTFKELNKLIKKLKKNKKGLSILQGERGTGKTNSINYIASNVDKMFFYINSNLLDSTINNPEFRNFLKKYENPVVIIDDCESLLNDMFGRSNQTTNNIIQLVDGLSSDSVSVNIICIFNDELEVDDILLECNNLLSVVNFEYLTTEESNELSKLIGSNKKYKNKTRLIDIINKKEQKSDKKIGF
jgi:hypothetical protein